MLRAALFRSALTLVLMPFFLRAGSGQEWQPKQAPLMTRWAKDVTPDKVLPDRASPQT